MITLNTYAGEWPGTDDHAHSIVDLRTRQCALAVPWPTYHQIKTLVKDLQPARFSGS
jgi:hypothetical protein